MRLIFLLLLVLPCNGAWLGAWKYRAPITITNAQAGALTNYPVQVSLTSSNFTFSQALSDGSDLRVTDVDGTTIIPYTILSFDSIGQTATIWIRPSSIAGSGTYVPYLYWGNASPTAFDIPPAGPFTRYASNPVITSGGNAENFVFDPDTAKYWMCTSSGMYSSTDLLAWTVQAGPAGCAHLLVSGGTWYFYSLGFSTIDFTTASTVTGTRSAPTTLITTGSGWKSTRVGEPYVFQDTNGTWVMLYMGDTDTGTGEQVGYATASSPGGPFTDYGSNPLIAFGSSGTFDAGTIADPHVYKANGTYYLFYTCSSVATVWSVCLATSTDLISINKLGPVLWISAASGDWDHSNSFRGGLLRVADTYYMSYANGANSNGIATQSAKSTAVGYPPQQIFSFWDDFSGASIDLTRWLPDSGGTKESISGGILTIQSGVGALERLYANTASGLFTWGTGSVLETNVQRTALSTSNAGELGWGTANSFVARILDNSTSSGFWLLDPGGSVTSSASHPDTSYHVQSIWRKSTSETDFRVDAAASLEAKSGSWSSAQLNPWLESFGAGGQNTLFNVDWVRVRPMTGSDPTFAKGTVESLAVGNALSFSIP